MTSHRLGDRVMHVIVPQREGAVGGSDLHVIDLAVAQQRHGHWRPLVLAPRASIDYRERLRDAGVELVTVPRWGVGAWSRLPSMASLGLVHGHGYEANYLISGLRRVSRQWARLPMVVTGHGWIETSLWLRFKSALDRVSARSAHVRIASAAAHAARFGRAPRPTVVIHNGIITPDSTTLRDLRVARSPLRARFGLPLDAFVVGAVGRLSTEKRLDLLLTSARHVLASHPEVYLLIVGGGNERARLEARARGLGIAERVRFTGLLRDVTSAYATMDLMVQASDTEGTPRTVLEAMAHGVPVIATDVGDLTVMLDGGAVGVLIPRGDVRRLAAAIIEMIERPALRAQLAERAGQRCRAHFGLEAMRRKVHDAYAVAQRSAGAGAA